MNARLRILHLEDSPADSELIHETLAMEEISGEVVRVETESEFVSALQLGGFDLILADYTLPSFDGISALKIAQRECPDVPFIFASGTLGEDVAIESLKIGATDYILKTRLSRLVPAIHRARREAEARTELRRSEETLREQASLLSLTHDAIYVRDLKGVVQYWNRSAEVLYGWPEADAVGKVAHELLKTVFPLSPEQIEAELLRTGGWEGELVKTRKAGTQLVVASRWSLKRDDAGRPIAILVTSNDITERKRTEQSLAFSSVALNNVRESAFLVDEKSRIHYVNEEACRALGYTREELLGMCIQDIDPDFRMERWSDHWAAVKSNQSLIFESRHRAKDGRVFPVELNSNYFEYGGKAYILGLARDISERKQAEEATLEARVSERTRIARELHDTLLQSFHGLLLRFKAVSLLLPKRPMEAKNTLDSAIKRAAEAIAEGRDAVQGLRESTVQGNDLAQAIRSLGEELANNTRNQAPVGFHVSVGGEPRNLHPIVRDEIYKISAEAMRNAFRHADANQVAVAVHYENEQIRLRVRDDGKGIDAEALSRNAREGHYGIPGMRERAAIMGGNLELWSEVGGGTEVELCVPASKAYATEERSSWSSGTLSGTSGVR